MDAYSNIKCWEVMGCDNIDCPARHEPEIPCWELAKGIEDFRNISNTCEDCIVYVLKEETFSLGTKELQNIIIQRGLLKKSITGHQICALEAKTNYS